MNSESIIRQLLEGFTDARCPLTASEYGSGSGLDNSMPPEWYRGSYEPLERALKEMKKRSKEESSIPFLYLGTLWYHTAMRYLMSERKAVWKVGEHTVDEMVHWKSCKLPCQFKFHSATQARAHIEKVHKPKPELTTVYPQVYQDLLRDKKDRCELCERLAVRWLAEWFERHGITPHLPSGEKS